jgi:hypothetical protein
MLLCTMQEFSQQTFADLTQTDFENVYKVNVLVSQFNPCFIPFYKKESRYH